ncbi:MAG: hypothetical protein ABI306_08795 [Caulobacteraceae bacterium]
MPANKQSSDFKYIFTNGFGLSFSGNEVIIKFGIVEDPSKPTESLLEQVGVVMTLPTVKTITYLLTKTMENFELANNMTVPLDAAKIAEIDQQVNAGIAPPKRR